MGIKRLFDDKMARRELKRYKKKGPSKSTRKLLDFIIREGVEGRTLMDIGGGIGAIQHELYKAGIVSSVDIDASSAYLNAAKKESELYGNLEHSQFLEGDFTDEFLCPEPADIVTLDRVICCYDEMEKLVEKSSSLAKKIYAVVYPREVWYVILGLYFTKFAMFVIRHPYRMYVHSSEKVDSIIRGNGFTMKYNDRTILWRVDVYGKI